MRTLFAAFRKPAVSAALNASAVAEQVPTQGLIALNYAIFAEAAGEVTLEVAVAGVAKPALRKALSLEVGAQQGWAALHGHLLPNGPAEVTLRLVDRGKAVAEKTITVQVRNEGETARQVAASLRAAGTPLGIEGPCDSRFYDYADPSLAAWFDREPEVVEAHLADLAARGAATPEEIEALRHFTAEGYMVLPGKIDPEHIERLNAAVDDAVARKVEGYEWGSNQRLHNLHQDYPAIRELWLHPKVLRMLELVFGEPAKPCQSLTYVFGSEQQFHQDVIHLTPFPAGRMCGVWTALEDVQPESGELMVYPKSHKLARVYMGSVGAAKVTDDWTQFGETVAARWEQMIVSNDLGREVYRPKAGQVLIWHENLMHGGVVRRDKTISRRSIVGHYFAGGAIVYHDSSGMPGTLHEGAAD